MNPKASPILVVDDDASIREALAKVLRDIGYTVVLAVDGEQAIAELEGNRFELLILDLNLPKLCGWDVLDVVASRLPGLPVIILTGLADQCEPGALFEADALLEKPPDVAVLLGTVATLLAERPEDREKRIGQALAPAWRRAPYPTSYIRSY